MRPNVLAPGLAALVTVATWCVGGGTAWSAPRPDRKAATTTTESKAIEIERAALDVAPLRLRRAVTEHGAGNLRGVVENLEAIDYAMPAFADADRAAFLLGQTYLQLGDVARFIALARKVSAWQRQTAYTRWLAVQAWLFEIEVAGAMPPTSADESGAVSMPLTMYFEALALEAQGKDAASRWVQLSTADTTTRLGRDLAGAAIVRRATVALSQGEDPRALLRTVPAGSRYAARARHMIGMIALERGQLDQAAHTFESLLADDSTDAVVRETRMALAGVRIELGRWEEAHHTYQRIDDDWSAQRDTLRRMLATGATDRLWASWESSAQISDALVLDAMPVDSLAGALAISSADLAFRAPAEVPTPDAPLGGPGLAWPVAPPVAPEWESVRASGRRIGETREELQRTLWAMARERAALDDGRRYLGIGLDRAQREAAGLETRTALLDSLRRTLDEVERRLQTVRDEATRRILRRGADLLERCADDLLWIGGMRRFHIEGPNREREQPMPRGIPSPESLLAGEEALARSVQGMVERLVAEGPGLIARSYERAWRPNLIDRAIAQGIETHRALAWARAIGTSIDSSIATSGSSETLRRLTARSETLQRTADSLETTHAALRRRVARQAVERALAALDPEREAIDYGLATSAYGWSVGSGVPAAATVAVATQPAGDVAAPVDSTVAAAGAAAGTVVDPNAIAPAAVRDSATNARASGADPDDPAAGPRRARAIELIGAFLGRHPQSPARGEMRFRLADLRIVAEHQDFNQRMARYLRRRDEGHFDGSPLPILDHSRALELYRLILAEDRDFEHTDAVLFNAAMILADEGSDEAGRYFEKLVADHPTSPYCAEAYLRMGDLRFNDRHFEESIALYRRAATSVDPNVRIIALYKMGWAHYNQDHFRAAADAFSTVLDLQAAERGALQADVESEAEAYLVHSLAGAGGARAFAETFDRIGARPYERRVLMSLGQQYRRLGRFDDAAAADELFIRRYPREADALVSAERLVDTYRRGDKSAAMREAQLSYATRFSPGGEWSTAQSSDSVRAAGTEFSRAALKSVALHHHREARARGSDKDWQEALRLYGQVLTQWPDDPDAATLELNAGEASARLGDYSGALAHYGAAATSRDDSIAAQALWQRVAVNDAWYDRTRGGKRLPGAPDADSLAHAVLESADQLLERFPNHPNSADLIWRQGNLAFAHGWDDRATRDFEHLTERHPNDPRAARAAILRADAFFRTHDYEAAGRAYEAALAAARRTGVDSLERRAAQAIPVAYYRQAEAAVTADSTRHEHHAELFERVATRWPQYEHADQAEYRAGLAYLAADKKREAVSAMETLIREFPQSDLVRDAHLQVARIWESDHQPDKSAEAYARFAQRYPDDPSAKDAWLKGADLLAASGSEARAEELRLAYLRKYPDDFETALEVRETLALRELNSIGPERPISTLLPAKKKALVATTSSHLAEYLRLAAAHPKLASKNVLARVRFLEGEELHAAYDKLRITQPLKKSIPAKQKLLDQLVARYRQSADIGVSEWTNASTFRIGEALVAFGQALEGSQRPADLTGDDLLAYQEVLTQRSQPFYDRGEAVWMDLLKQKSHQLPNDPWIARAQSSLWPRLSSRFFFHPEAEYPLAEATPDRKHDRDENAAPSAQEPLETGKP